MVSSAPRSREGEPLSDDLGGSRILVTGAGGFIGSHLTEALLHEGASVRALVHYDSRGDWARLTQVHRYHPTYSTEGRSVNPSHYTHHGRHRTLNCRKSLIRSNPGGKEGSRPQNWSSVEVGASLVGYPPGLLARA